MVLPQVSINDQLKEVQTIGKAVAAFETENAEKSEIPWPEKQLMFQVKKALVSTRVFEL